MKTKLLQVLLLAGLPVGLALGSPAGELDPAFGDHGRVLLRAAPFEEFASADVFMEPGSNKLLIVGDGYGSDRLLRLNSDGSLDQGFGDQGSVQLDFGGSDLRIGDAHWLPDGKLLIAGTLDVYGTSDNVIHGSALLARFHADGTPDTSFGNGGRAVAAFGGVFEGLSELLVQPDGRIVVFGAVHRDDRTERVLARFTPDGLLDSSFGNSTTPGVSTINVLGLEVQLAAMLRQRDGKLLICGDAAPGPTATGSNIVAIRTQPAGTPDPTFGNNGMLLIGSSQDPVQISACMELADEHVIFLGSAGTGAHKRAAAWRMTPDGRIDTGFGAGGMLVLATDTPSAATAMLTLADGSVAIAGAQWSPIGFDWFLWSDMFVSRIDPTTGNVDREFGHQGLTAIDFGHGDDISVASPARIMQQADGKLVVVGSQAYRYDWYYWFNIAVARIDPFGAGSNGWASMIDSLVTAPAEGGNANLHLRRTGGSTGQLTVDYRTVAATAMAGRDYVDASGTVTWSDGDMDEKMISITVLNPGEHADGRTFHVALSNSSGGLAKDQAMIYIPASSPPGGSVGSNPPGSGGARNVGSVRHGGGAIGIELWVLLVLGAFRVFARCRRAPRVSW